MPLYLGYKANAMTVQLLKIFFPTFLGNIIKNKCIKESCSIFLNALNINLGFSYLTQICTGVLKIITNFMELVTKTPKEMKSNHTALAT